MKYKKKLISIFVLLFLVVSLCYIYSWKYLHKYEELEKVLTHYTNDSLKLKAARFLIDNMYGKFSYESEQLEHYDTLFSLYASYVANGGLEGDPPFAFQCWDSIRRVYGPINMSLLQKRYDNEFITAEFLIKEIDTAFEAWKSVPDSFVCSFDLFCRYVLPYRIGTEPLEPIRKNILDDFRVLRDSSMYSDSALIRSLFTEFRKVRLFSNSRLLWGYPVSISKSNLQRARRGACMHLCEYYVSVLRACGIPSTIDYVTQWGNHNLGHTWVVALKDSGQVAFDALGKKQLKFSYKPTKIYRRTYELQSINEHARAFVPNYLLASDCIDVSNLYFPVHQVQVKGEDEVVRIYKNYPYGVICAFDNRQWRPVDYGKVEDGVFTFDNIIGDVCYIAGYYDHGAFIPATLPFILSSQGKIHFIKAKSSSVEVLHLTRKYPKFPRIISFLRAIKGGVVEISNDKDFRTAHKLMDVYTDSRQDVIDLQPKHILAPHRYVRIRGIGNLAEVVFYGRRPGDLKDTELTGVFKGFPESDGMYSWKKAIDKDYNTYFANDPKRDNYVVLDLGNNNSYTITRVRYVPRSDTNFIIPGYRYRLDYWDDKKHSWNTVGEKRANDFFIDFENVSTGRLYILHCLEGGTEERIFTYENGKQCWW